MADRRHGAAEREGGVLERGAVLAEIGENGVAPLDLAFGFRDVLLQALLDLGIMLNARGLRLYDRESLVLHRMSVLEASHENRAQFVWVGRLQCELEPGAIAPLTGPTKAAPARFARTDARLVTLDAG